MEITMYELLGKIKDGNVPKEIEYEGYLLSWDNVDKDYYCEEYGNLFEYLFREFQTTELLNFKVEILEKENELSTNCHQLKIPEKLDIEDDGNAITLFGEKENEWTILDNVDVIICNKINSIIDYLKSKGE